MCSRTASAFVFALLATTSSEAVEFRVHEKESLVAVVTHKGGFASGLAHDHLIAATGYRYTLEFEAAAPESARFELDVAAVDLAVDRPDLKQTWAARLQELGILPGQGGDLSDKQRDKIRRSMLGERQLDAGTFPEISASVVAIQRDTVAAEPAAFSYLVTLALQVRGKRVERPVRARYALEGDRLTVEAVGAFRFTEFGIKPFSAMLGAVKNQDEFQVYVQLTAFRVGK